MRKHFPFTVLQPASILLAMAIQLGPALPVAAQGGKGHAPALPEPERPLGKPESEAVQPQAKGDPYLLATDPVSGQPLPAKPVISLFEGRELRFSDQASLDTFTKEPGKYLPAIDRMMIEQQLPFYPIKTCVVSGEKLGGDMGPAVDRIMGNRLVRFCCKDCVAKFAKTPDKFLSALDQSVIKAQAGSYPAGLCVVSGEELNSMDGPVDVVLGNRLVRLCCRNCEKTLRADPAKYLAKLAGKSGK